MTEKCFELLSNETFIETQTSHGIKVLLEMEANTAEPEKLVMEKKKKKTAGGRLEIRRDSLFHFREVALSKDTTDFFWMR